MYAIRGESVHPIVRNKRTYSYSKENCALATTYDKVTQLRRLARTYARARVHKRVAITCKKLVDSAAKTEVYPGYKSTVGLKILACYRSGETLELQ